ncbi:titin-like [Salvia hispanica]|uniref:titin-like n=1 Tax=Salvia hispanica TaxID=49212 RepID=UPI002009AD88|nr:titin-like [Salvia hispanica]
MGKKKITTSEKKSEDPTTMEARPLSTQRSQPAPPPQIPTMVPLDALATYLRQQEPNRDWTATLAGFGQIGGVPAIPTPTPEIATTVNPPTTTPTSSNPTSKKISPTATAPSEPSNPSPRQLQTEPLDVSPLSAYQDPNWGETEEKDSEGRVSEGGEDKSEETPIAEPVTQEAEREEIDLNEMARKQGLLTDDEFHSVLGGGDKIVINTEGVAEVLNLASQAVGEGEASIVAEESEGVVHQPVQEMGVEQTEGVKQPEEERQETETHKSEERKDEKETEEEAEVQPKEPETIAPTVSKPKPVKRKLVLKNDPKEERQKPKRVSQRCLGKWTSNKAGANTAADAVEISSEDERATPTKPGEEPSTTSREDAPMATGTVSSTPNDQEEEADKVAEGLDLASESVGQEEAINDNTSTCVVTEPTAQVDLSTPADEEAKANETEDMYLQERKRKGKAPAKKKHVVKKQRIANTSIVIREPGERKRLSDSDYTSSEESESESDISLDGEEYHEQQLPDNHQELVHPPVERIVYRRWRVELTDELMEDMKHYNTKKLQDAFDDKEDNNKQVKCGKVLHIPSLDELSVRDPFLASMGVLGFEWLLENRDPEISVRAQQGQEGRVGQNEQAQGQRQANLERVVAELAEENRQSRAEMARLTSLMESVLKELARGKESTGAGPSGHGGQDDEPTEPEKEESDGPEETEENPTEATEEEPKESPAQSTAPRRSRRNVRQGTPPTS